MASLLFTVLFAFVAGTLGRSLDPHIIGGSNAYPGEFPHQGSLQRGTFLDADGADTYLAHTCGCALISTMWTITAAHCVGAGAGGLSVVMGLYKRGDANQGKPTRYQISIIYAHPRFDRRTLVNDIALMRMSSTVQMNEYVSTIAMPPTGTNFDGHACVITGWGVTTVGGGSLAEILQKATVTAYSNAQCRNDWNVGSGQICVGVYNQRGACNGDSGGPLVCGGMLAGLTSYGNNGCYPRQPSVYTRVSYYRSWIFGIAGI